MPMIRLVEVWTWVVWCQERCQTHRDIHPLTDGRGSPGPGRESDLECDNNFILRPGLLSPIEWWNVYWVFNAGCVALVKHLDNYRRAWIHFPFIQNAYALFKETLRYFSSSQNEWKVDLRMVLERFVFRPLFRKCFYKIIIIFKSNNNMAMKPCQTI